MKSIQLLCLKCFSLPLNRRKRMKHLLSAWHPNPNTSSPHSYRLSKSQIHLITSNPFNPLFPNRMGDEQKINNDLYQIPSHLTNILVSMIQHNRKHNVKTPYVGQQEGGGGGQDSNNNNGSTRKRKGRKYPINFQAN